MIDTLPLPISKCYAFPQATDGSISCIYCGFNGVIMKLEKPEGRTKTTTKKASFRYVNNLDNPTKGVCGRYECREKFKKQVKI
jgi:hypothetical protein